MPNYDYECSKCRKTFEIFQSMNDKTFTVCPKEKCRMKSWGKGSVKRLLGGGAGLIFKGSGFYTTDYRSEGYKNAAKKDSAASAPAKGEGSKSSSSESSKSPVPKTQ
jgi:putative FmdB family regulatory protein